MNPKDLKQMVPKDGVGTDGNDGPAVHDTQNPSSIRPNPLVAFFVREEPK